MAWRRSVCVKGEGRGKTRSMRALFVVVEVEEGSEEYVGL